MPGGVEISLRISQRGHGLDVGADYSEPLLTLARVKWPAEMLAFGRYLVVVDQ
jgi:hypothetical protein